MSMFVLNPTCMRISYAWSQHVKKETFNLQFYHQHASHMAPRRRRLQFESTFFLFDARKAALLIKIRNGNDQTGSVIIGLEIVSRSCAFIFQSLTIKTHQMSRNSRKKFQLRTEEGHLHLVNCSFEMDLFLKSCWNCCLERVRMARVQCS